MRLRFISLFVVLASVTTSGCASMCSTMLTRDESNTSWNRLKKLPGVPITLKVPTHVKLYIYETYFLTTVKVGSETHNQRLKLPYPVRDFGQEFIYTEKIFTVDFKRPAAGTFNLRMDMTDDQYIQKVQHDVTDITIQEVSNLIDTIAPAGLLPAVVDAETGTPRDRLYEFKSVVAVGIFEIDAPDFEQQVTGFINCHLNQAHDAWVAQPSVSEIHRISSKGYQEDSDLCRGVLVPHTPTPYQGQPSYQGQPETVPQGSAGQPPALYYSSPPLPQLPNQTPIYSRPMQ